MDDPAADSLLYVSQILNDQEQSQGSGAQLTRDKLSSGIKLILSKKPAIKSENKKKLDKTATKIEDNPKKKEHIR